MMSQPPNNPIESDHGDPSDQRAGFTSLFVTLALTIAATGYFVGLRQESNRQRFEPTNTSTDNATNNHITTGLDLAKPYHQMAAINTGPNRDWKNHLRNAVPSNLNALQSFDPSLRKLALITRASTRAYEGAPPLIPHPIDQTSTASCVACHTNGKSVGAVTAPKMSHPLYANCTQCHVESNSSFSPNANLLTDNSFQPLRSPGPGSRAWPGAPPTMPHKTWMRQDCSSCHGPLAQKGLQTTHPWRANCTQCHVPDATLEQPRFNPTPLPKLR